MAAPRIVLAGGSGFLGQALAARYAARGYDVVALTRGGEAGPHARAVRWDGRTVGEWARELDGAAALVNLAGKSVSCRYTPANRREIIASRVDSVRALDAALLRCAAPPPAWAQMSSLAIYGSPGDRVCDEGAPPGEGFPAETCLAWEAAVAERRSGVRTTVLRVGFALGPGGGALEPLARLARLFLGGAAGDGRQYISWLHVDDFVRIVERCLEGPAAEGIYNVTGPAPCTNAAFMAALRRAVGRPWSPPVPAPAVRLGARLMGTEPGLALDGRRCVPARLLAEGFSFSYGELGPALAQILG